MNFGSLSLFRLICHLHSESHLLYEYYMSQMRDISDLLKKHLSYYIEKRVVSQELLFPKWLKIALKRTFKYPF